MATKGISRRRLKKQLRYAVQGISLGTAASLAIISGGILLVRRINGRPLGHRVPFGFVLFVTVLIVIVYLVSRAEREQRGRKRPPARAAITELSEGDKTKSA